MRYGLARFARLYPLYAAVLLYDVIWNNRLSVHESIAPFLFAASLTQSWWHGVVGQHNLVYQFWNPVAVAWSISTEVGLYFLYPLLCLALIRVRAYWLNLAVVFLCVVAPFVQWALLQPALPEMLKAYESVFGRVVIENTLTGTYNDFVQWVMIYSPLARFWQFALGCALANLYFSRSKEWKPRMWTSPGVALALLFAFHVVTSHGSRSYMATILGPLTPFFFVYTMASHAVTGGFLIYSAASQPYTPTARFLGSWVMKRGGQASYATYLLHTVLLGYASMYIAVRAFPNTLDVAAIWKVAYLIATWAGIVTIGYIVFLVIESPARKWIRAHIPPVALLGIVALQLAAFIAGVAITMRPH